MSGTSIVRESGFSAHSRQTDITSICKASFDMLAENPRLARERQEIDPPVRIHPCGSHLVVYIETDDGNILVIRVRHYRENWQA